MHVAHLTFLFRTWMRLSVVLVGLGLLEDMYLCKVFKPNVNGMNEYSYSCIHDFFGRDGPKTEGKRA